VPGDDPPIVLKDLCFHSLQLHRQHFQRRTSLSRHPPIIRVGHDRQQPVEADAADG
jgi:hypothetical protein